jgi:hypothetical protein
MERTEEKRELIPKRRRSSKIQIGITRAASVSMIGQQSPIQRPTFRRRTTISPSIIADLTSLNSKNTPITPILHIGALGSGKTTFWKQVSIGTHSNVDLPCFISFIYANIIENMQIFCSYLLQSDLRLPRDWKEEMEHILSIEVSIPRAQAIFPTCYRSIRLLCMDDAFYNLLEQIKWKVQHDEMSIKFLNDIQRFDPGIYTPTLKDVIHVRKKTSGIVETIVNIGLQKFLLIDAGGARSERKKVIQLACFFDL